MGYLKAREPRTSVLLPATLCSGDGWGNVTICDVSARGLSFSSSEPPPRGTFVELRHQGLSIVGQVRWSAAGRCGVRTRDRIALAALLGSDAPVKAALRRQPAIANPLIPPRHPEAAERSRLAGQAMEWMALVVVGVLAAGAIAVSVQSALVAPLAQVRAGLSPHEH